MNDNDKPLTERIATALKRVERDPKPCSCEMATRQRWPEIHYCPMHEAAPELLEALFDIQWLGSIDGFPCCPACGKHEFEGHNGACRIALALGAAAGGRQ